MRCREIIERLETLAPERFACEWDNPGLLTGRMDKEVKKILLAVDVDDRVVDTAVEQGVDMIISHHLQEIFLNHSFLFSQIFLIMRCTQTLMQLRGAWQIWWQSGWALFLVLR